MNDFTQQIQDIASRLLDNGQVDVLLLGIKVSRIFRFNRILPGVQMKPKISFLMITLFIIYQTACSSLETAKRR